MNFYYQKTYSPRQDNLLKYHQDILTDFFVGDGGLKKSKNVLIYLCYTISQKCLSEGILANLCRKVLFGNQCTIFLPQDIFHVKRPKLSKNQKLEVKTPGSL